MPQNHLTQEQIEMLPEIYRQVNVDTLALQLQTTLIAGVIAIMIIKGVNNVCGI